MTDLKTLILASGSPYRRDLLGRLGLPFQSWTPDVDERPLQGEAPRSTAIRLARSKAQAGAARFPQAWIIGSDQVADQGGKAVGKPGSLENARAQLREMRGATVLFHTALCLLGPDARSMEETVSTDVAFRRLTDEEIERYLAREPAFDCAGSAKSEGLGISLLEHLRGDDPTALIGLPLIALSRMLRASGFELP